MATRAKAAGSSIQRSNYRVARFKLTMDAMTLAEEAGVQVDAWKDHWRRFAAVQDLAVPKVPTAALIELRIASERDGRTKRKGTAMPVDLSQPVVQDFLADLEDHNAFLHSVGVVGVDFIGLRRVFNGGDREGFNWRTGGRFYSIRYKGMEAAYEGMSGDDRRHYIRLGGEPVGEADMSASQLRLLYALLDTPVPATLAVDPYSLPGLPRDPVKLVVAQALGKGRPRSRTWGRDAIKQYAKEHPGRLLTKDHRFRAYESAVLAAHPILERLEDPDVPGALELQFVESEIIRKAMASLRREGIPSLPVHDSLVVPRGKLEEAGEALKDAFRSVVELVLGYTTEYSAAVSFK